MAHTNKIPIERWVEYCSLFTNGNKGRLVTISSINPESGYEILANEMPFMGIDYDPVNKGDDMVISLGKTSPEFGHVVEAPVELWENHDHKGLADLVRIVDQNNHEINITFG